MQFGGFTPSTTIDYPGKIAAMVYTIGCNFRCPYCHNPELVDETVATTYSETNILSWLKTRQNLLDGLVITGGEPTMHSGDLLNFMERVKELGFLVKLDTNGTDSDFLAHAIKNKLVDYVAMDIKSPLSTYYKIAGRPVNIGAIETSRDILINGSIDYEFRTTVIKALLTPNDLEEIAKSIRNAKQYYLQKFIPTKILNPQFKRKVTYDDNEFINFKSTAEKYVTYCGIR